MSNIALQKRISDVVAEYDEKLEALANELKDFKESGSRLISASRIGSTFGNTSIDTGRVAIHTLQQSLLKSAWLNIYEGMNIERIASAKDKKNFQVSMEKPAPFTLENIRNTFGDYIIDPRGNILRGLAEVFCALDPFYKSHDKMKVGAKGLPKRIIISGVGGFYGWGEKQLEDVINALAAYQGKPMVTHTEMRELLDNQDALLDARGIRLKRFNNGNGHLFFEPNELKDINLALAEYYGDILADCHEEKPSKKRQSTGVSKDLQYYPTPSGVVERVVDGLRGLDGAKVLEPSCGCGRFMDSLRAKGAEVIGVEFDQARAQQCRDKGHAVVCSNFLEVPPSPEYDHVVMNPPFYGTHYAKHVNHALKFLKEGGTLTAILPVTARYDHGLLDGKWQDLPFGSFRESGTNINTTVLTIKKESAQ